MTQDKRIVRNGFSLGGVARVSVIAGLAGAAGVVALVVSLTGMGGPAVRGDLNCNGRVSFADVPPFVLAVHDPAAWGRQYKRDFEYLLSIADFSGNGVVDLADIPGFAGELKKGLRGPEGGGDSLPEGGGGLLLARDGNADLDVDSDNDNGANPPGRTPAEDQIEDDPYLTGKQIQTASIVKAVLEFVATGATPLPSLTYRLTFPGNVSVAVPAFCEHVEQPLASYQTNTYPYPKWVLGDMNGDGVVNMFDIDPFILALTNKPVYCQTHHQDADVVGDFTGDWVLNDFDIDPFVQAIGQPPKPIPVRFLITGQTVSGAQGETRVYAEADCDGNEQFDPATETDAVRTTVWNGQTLPRPAELGAPREWGAGLSISPFSTVNLRNANVVTSIPLAGWDPVGPALSFGLYHNSQAGTTDYSAWGFDLGGGWSVSYGSRIEGASADASVVLVEADAKRTVFTKQGGTYVAPLGVHELLAWDVGQNRWTVTSPNLTKAVFNGSGYLIEVLDSSGNKVLVHRDAEGRIDYVKTAADTWIDDPPSGLKNRLVFTYYDPPNAGRLQKITDPINREWIFHYDSGRLSQIEYPGDGYVETSYEKMTYDAQGRIQDIHPRDSTPQNPKWWIYTYTEGRLTKVQDPIYQTQRYERRFAYAGAPVNGLWETTYTDRRSNPWVVRFDTLGNARELTNPLSLPPEQKTRRWEWDADHNATGFTDELGHRWSALYGSVGNLLTMSSPIPNQMWTWTWEHPNGTPDNFRRLTQVTDPAGHWVQYAYANMDPNDPTLVTSVTEQQALPGDPYGETTTTLEYYGAQPPNSRGQLKLVVDGNAVNHTFEYDQYGYFLYGQEGLNPGGDDLGNPVPTGSRSSNNCGTGCACWKCIEVPTQGGSTFCCLPVLYTRFGAFASCAGIMCDNDEALPAYRRLGNVPSVAVPSMVECPGQVQHDVLNRLLYMKTCALETQGLVDRTIDPEYDSELGRLTSLTVTSSLDVGADITRITAFNEYDADGRVLSLTGPDGALTTYTYDELGRPKTVTRGMVGVEYTYDQAGRLTQVDHKYGVPGVVKSKVLRHYDDANRLDWIEHRDATNQLLMRIDYVWNLNNTLFSRTEFNATVQPTQTAVVTFQYDNRDRLIHETRVVNGSTTVYDLGYTYDGLGNRLQKSDEVAGRRTCYVYDTDWDSVSRTWRSGMCYTPEWTPEYDTRNNRLLEYREFQRVGEVWTLARTVKYVYYITGHASNIIIKDAGDPLYRGLALYYTSAGKLWRAVWERWKEPSPGQYQEYTRWQAREFYYDGARQRYLSRAIDVSSEIPDEWKPTQEPQLWTDYLGDDPYADFAVVEKWDGVNEKWYIESQTEKARYTSGYGTHAQQDAQTGATRYLHGDLIRSTMLTTDQGGTVDETLAYTAFGEPVGPGGVGVPPASDTRYRYAGGWGYEDDLLKLDGAQSTKPIVLLHVGWRWYDASIGRFLQRDPIGIAGGLNTYVYVGNVPTLVSDPLGLMHWEVPWPPERDKGRPPRPPRPPSPPGPGPSSEQSCRAHAAVRGIGAIWVIGGVVITVLPGGQVIGPICVIAGTAMWAHEDIAAIGDALSPEPGPPETNPFSGPGPFLP